MARQRVVLIDGTALLFRAYFAMPSELSTASGQPTNAAFGFATMFARLLAAKTPRFGAVVFDAPGRNFRHVRYPAYKANRRAMPADLSSQIPLIERIVAAHGFPMLRVAGVEADDVIGTLCRMSLAAGHEVHIVSGDKDFAQLVGPHVRLDDPLREVVHGPELVFKRWEVRPDQFVDWLALVGDASDNIPGVPGIGKRGAAQLLAEFGSLDAMLADPDAVGGSRGAALQTHAEQARMSADLATIRQDLALGTDMADLAVPVVDTVVVDAIYRELEFYSLLSGEGDGQDAISLDYGLVSTDVEVMALLDALDPDQPVALLALHDVPRALQGALAGISIGIEPGLARFIPFPGRLSRTGGLALKRWIEDPAMPKVTHCLRDTWVVLARHGLMLRGCVGDTGLASFLVDPTRGLPHTLDVVVREYLHRTVRPFKGLVGTGKKRVPLAQLDPQKQSAYGCHLVDATLAAWGVLRPLLAADELLSLLESVELPLSVVLGRIELTGIRVAPEVLATLEAGLKEEGRLVEETIFELATHSFNVGSLKQLSTVLFDELKLPVLKRTKTGYSTDASVMAKLSPMHPIIAPVMRWRAIAKLIQTYTDVLQHAVDEHTGRIHCTLHQTASVSGRLISSDPDLQRTPVRTPEGRRIREAFVPSEGHVLLSADWSQIELRLLAHFSGDPLLVAAFVTGADVHVRTAAEIFGVQIDDVNHAQRQVGKTVNFATIYGQGAAALGEQIGVSTQEARALIRRYFKRYSGVRTWLDSTIELARRDGFVRTLLGRKRRIRELSSRNPTDRSYGERIATNTPIQGSAADLCKLAMLQLNAALPANGLHGAMVLQIHDELLLDVPADEVEDTVELVRLCMESVYPLRVPLVVDVGTGDSWGSAH